MKPSFRKVRIDSKGSFYVNVPRRFARALDLKDEEKVELRLATGNTIELRKKIEQIKS